VAVQDRLIIAGDPNIIRIRVPELEGLDRSCGGSLGDSISKSRETSCEFAICYHRGSLISGAAIDAIGISLAD
jgi:hypothetical protein